jgi:hypothetical protein
MLTLQKPLSLPFAVLAICLTACGDGDAKDPPEACEEAGCDAGSFADADTDAEGEEETPVDPPDVDVPDAPEDAEVDSGLSPVEIDAGSDSDGGANQSDTGTVDPGDAALSDAGVDAQVVDASTQDASTQDASVTLDAGTDSGPSNNDASVPAFVPVRFSATDHGAAAYLSNDRLRVENRGEELGNARSDTSIAPGSGVFYFEAHRQIATVGFYGVGIATSSASLTAELGSSPASIGMFTEGGFANSTAVCTGAPGFQQQEQKFYYGLVVDYRGANPRVHYVLDDGAGGVEVVRSCTAAITTPVFIMYSGARWEVGYQIAINTGADTTNHPFHFTPTQVRAALNGVSETSAATAIVFGFGKTRALPLSASPALAPPADRSVTAGASVLLTGTASDAEDGNLTSSIVWRDLYAQHHAPVTGTGGSFTFTAALGRHPIVMSVTDSVGRTTEHTVMVTAGGTLPTPSPVRFVIDSLSGDDTDISPDGLSVDVHAGTKNGVRANTGIFGQYWYFEAHRNGSSQNEGVGLVIPDGDLNPYDFVNVPWSMSINLSGSTWYNLISQADWSNTFNHYGFAVDYRGLHPIVHVIINGALHRSVLMKDVWGPIYPMAYGNPFYVSPDVDPGYDITLNFGGDRVGRPFVFNPAAILGTLGTGLQTGWGAHAL